MPNNEEPSIRWGTGEPIIFRTGNTTHRVNPLTLDEIANFLNDDDVPQAVADSEFEEVQSPIEEATRASAFNGMREYLNNEINACRRESDRLSRLITSNRSLFRTQNNLLQTAFSRPSIDSINRTLADLNIEHERLITQFSTNSTRQGELSAQLGNLLSRQITGTLTGTTRPTTNRIDPFDGLTYSLSYGSTKEKFEKVETEQRTITTKNGQIACCTVPIGFEGDYKEIEKQYNCGNPNFRINSVNFKYKAGKGKKMKLGGNFYENMLRGVNSPDPRLAFNKLMTIRSEYPYVHYSKTTQYISDARNASSNVILINALNNLKSSFITYTLRDSKYMHGFVIETSYTTMTFKMIGIYEDRNRTIAGGRYQFLIKDMDISPSRIGNANTHHDILCKYYIKSSEASAKAFGFTKEKLEMVNMDLSDKKHIESYEFDMGYKSKKVGIVDTIVITRNGKNYRFLLSDIYVILPSIDGIKERVDKKPIKEGSTVKIIDDRKLGLKKNQEVKVINKYQTNKYSKKQDIFLVQDITNNKTHIVKGKNIKLIS